MASKGYPGEYKKNTVIKGIEKINNIPNIKVFHAGTSKNKSGQIISNGGRVLSLTANAKDIPSARKIVYEAIKKIEWDEGFYRKDIGKK